MLLRVLVSPRYAPTLILGRLVVRNQVPEYVGARQEIQRTTPAQLLILLGLVAYLVLVAVLFHAGFAVKAVPLFGG